uniref:J domain-containing protein n=1 Tax=Terrapene triunguis TaxID=2587831 RepID=A0A674K0G9_9SAUR
MHRGKRLEGSQVSQVVHVVLHGERRKAIRRLYLRYHPDKNVGQEEMANEVCKYLRERIQELEEGRKPRAASNPRSPQASGGRHHPSSHRGFSASWDEWDGEARHHRQSRREFTGQRDHGFHYDFWSYHRAQAGRRPQAEEAGRWLRQAQSDLRAAGHDVGQRCGLTLSPGPAVCLISAPAVAGFCIRRNKPSYSSNPASLKSWCQPFAPGQSSFGGRVLPPAGGDEPCSLGVGGFRLPIPLPPRSLPRGWQ